MMYTPIAVNTANIIKQITEITLNVFTNFFLRILFFF